MGPTWTDRHGRRAGNAGRHGGWPLPVGAAGIGATAVTGWLVSRWWVARGPAGGPLAGSDAPDFTLPALGGTKLTLSQLRGSPDVLVEQGVLPATAPTMAGVDAPARAAV